MADTEQTKSLDTRQKNREKQASFRQRQRDDGLIELRLGWGTIEEKRYLLAKLQEKRCAVNPQKSTDVDSEKLVPNEKPSLSSPTPGMDSLRRNYHIEKLNEIFPDFLADLNVPK